MDKVEIEINEKTIMIDKNIKDRIEKLEKAIDYIQSRSHSSNVTDRAREKLYEALDNIELELDDRIVDSNLNDCEKELKNASKYCGYTNIQYGAMEKLKDMLQDD